MIYKLIFKTHMNFSKVLKAHELFVINISLKTSAIKYTSSILAFGLLGQRNIYDILYLCIQNYQMGLIKD